MSLVPSGKRAVIKVVSVEEIHDNTSQEVITITTDKLKLALLSHVDCMEKKDAWHMPLSLLVGVVVVFCSSTFKTAFGLSADTWQAIFVIFGGGCFVWFCLALRDLKKATSLEELIQVIKNKQ